MTSFFRMLDIPVDSKADALRSAVRGDDTRLEVDPTVFSQIPGSPFAYWVRPHLLALFKAHPPLESGSRIARAGGQTSDDDRYLRAWWEVSSTKTDTTWRTYIKGGAPTPFYLDQALLARWDTERGTFPGFLGRPGRASEKPSNVELYFLPGITWPLRAKRFAPQVMPADSIFTVRGYAIIDDRENLSATLALTSSKAFDFLAKLLLGRFEFPEFVVGAIQQIPLPQLSVEASRKLDRLVRQAWKSRRDLDSTREMSHAFLLPAVLSEKVTGLDRRALEQELKSIEAEIDEMAFGLYGIGPEDRTVIEVTSNRVLSSKNSEQTEADFLEGSDAAEDEDMNVGAKETLDSWLVGVVFGRFDARLATGQRSVPSDPDPFDPLPSRSLGMWPEGEISDCLADIMVDDKGRNDDLAACIQSVATRLGVEVSDNIRPWLAKEFFPLHIKMYSKSRRKAPIYWQLATPSANYSAWLYIHAFTKDTLFRVQHDYVAPKLAHESRLLESLRDELGDRGAASKRKALAAQEAFVEELRTFLEEVKRVAPIWNPNLDDGVIINFAPLWRLVPQHKAWQKELKATLDALCEGKYDWSHLAMRLWPERVVPKCVDDRSLAIAHGLELIFWEEDAAGVWKQRETPISPVEKVVANRSSEAVKAALKSLMEAPDLNGPGKRGRKSARA